MLSKQLLVSGARLARHGHQRLYSKAAAAMPLAPMEMPECAYKPPQYSGPDYDEAKAIRMHHLTPNMSTYYDHPLMIHAGHMQWLFDHTGKRYLDMIGGIVTVSVGHCHPKVNKALHNQIDTLWHTTNIYMHPKIHEYAKRLTDKLPEELSQVYFVNSGAEANDLAMLLARLYTNNHEIISLRNGYHGMSPHTMGLTAMSPWRYAVPGISNGTIHAMQPDPYQGIWGGAACRDSPVQTTRSCDCNDESGCKATDHYINQLEEIFRYSLPFGKVAGMFAESIQGIGGTVQFPKDYLRKAVDLVHCNGGLFISDEVQTGFGRTGDHYWGFEGHGIVPDIVTMAKGIGNGFPMAAVVTTPRIAMPLATASHFNTFGGNPMACAVGMSVMDVIEEEKLQQNAQEVGTYFLQSLAQLRDRYDIIGDVRGKGLMIGVELVENRETREPMSAPHMNLIWNTCMKKGVLFGKGGLHGNVLRIKPPMCVNKSDVDFAVNVLERIAARFIETRK